ncbi:MAG: tetratricopeptide repeat protein, partial [Candidatus Omnitrophica bacterium]|nr:tetratricopeptide repeat protein [Candidatus Omnitrophota bacterium]
FGVGAGNYFIWYPIYSNGRDRLEFVQFAHNDYLQLLAEFGVIGFLLLGAWVYLITLRGASAVKALGRSGEGMIFAVLLSATLAIGIDAFFSYDWYMTVPSVFLWFIWGIFESKSSVMMPSVSTKAFFEAPFKGYWLFKWLFALIAVSVVFSGARGIYEESRAHLLFGNSHRELGAGRIENAISLMQSALRYKPRTARYRYVLGSLYLQHQEFEKALAEFQIAKQLTPNVFITNLSFAVTNYILGNLEVAKEEFKKLADRHPEDIFLEEQFLSILNDQANLFVDRGAFDKAIQNYELLISRNSNLSAVHYNLGNVYFRMKDFEKALQSYQTAYQIDPKRFLIVFKIAHTSQLMNRPGEAIQFYQEAISLEPENYQPYLNLGILLLEKNDSEGVSYLKKSLERAPDQPQKEIIEQAIKTGKMEK